MVVTVSTPSQPTGCPACGVIATGRGRRPRVLHDVPGVTPVRVLWRQRVWRCVDPDCTKNTFVEQLPDLVAPRGSITRRAIAWAIGQLRREHATVQGLARQLGTSWKTVCPAVQPELERMADDSSRFDGVTIWHHVDPRRQGLKELTGMVDLTRDEHGKVRARLLDLVPGRSGKAYATWLRQRGTAFRRRVKVAALDPFAGYKNAIDDELDYAVAVLDAFHVVKLGTAAVDEVRHRVQQSTLGHRGRKGDSLYGIQTILRAGRDNLTEKQLARLHAAFTNREEHVEVEMAWRCAQQLRDAYLQADLTTGRAIAETVVETFHTCPIPEIARLGRTLRRWREAFLAYFSTGRANNGGTEAINGIIELHRRLARGFRNRDNYPLRMLLTTGGLTP
ncbi:ISL3 family transposase [Brevibacterium luteolum]|uniref:ISL3 family transposase n=2 Tax=Brevibacterium luteolum TaxID=199591 RepID=A0A849AQN5_9MICO|nr:ISL3 family transposase [Brevibacterium luteolum]NNG78481.1 ISL3 family transposase [Brevibacterium luteolum]